jgi:hypothetical protein
MCVGKSKGRLDKLHRVRSSKNIHVYIFFFSIKCRRVRWVTNSTHDNYEKNVQNLVGQRVGYEQFKSETSWCK